MCRSYSSIVVSVILYSVKKLIRDNKTPRFVPDYMAESVLDIDFELLKKQGVKYVAFDADSTLVPFRGTALSKASEKFLKMKRPLFKDWCIASNRVVDDLKPLARAIDAHLIQATILNRKPQKRFFRQVIEHFKPTNPKEIAMIGDKLIADMWGAKRMDMTTVWVERIGADGIHDRVIQTRRFEKKLMKPYVKD